MHRVPVRGQDLDVLHMSKAVNRENNITKQSLEPLQAGEEGGRQESAKHIAQSQDMSWSWKDQ